MGCWKLGVVSSTKYWLGRGGMVNRGRREPVPDVVVAVPNDKPSAKHELQAYHKNLSICMLQM